MPVRLFALTALALLPCCGRVPPVGPEPERAPPPPAAPVRQEAPRAPPAVTAPDAGASPGEPAASPAPDPCDDGEPRSYPWLAGPPGQALCERFAAPAGFARVRSERGSFASYLRRLPLKPPGAPVLLHDGTPKGRQDVHAAVVDIDVGARDLQQCADAVMRLRAEHLRQAGRERDVCFLAANGERLAWKGGGYAEFRRYLNRVFAFANSASLLRQLRPVDDEARPEIGDVYIVPAGGHGFGHAVLVVDAADDARGRRAVLLVQSYMPAQEIHVLENLGDAAASPWYLPAAGAGLRTPEWSFPAGALRRFGERGCGAGPG